MAKNKLALCFQNYFKIFLRMGNNPQGSDQNQKRRDDQPKKKPLPPPPRVGRKKKNKGS